MVEFILTFYVLENWVEVPLINGSGYYSKRLVLMLVVGDYLLRYWWSNVNFNRTSSVHFADVWAYVSVHLCTYSVCPRNHRITSKAQIQSTIFVVIAIWRVGKTFQLISFGPSKCGRFCRYNEQMTMQFSCDSLTPEWFAEWQAFRYQFYIPRCFHLVQSIPILWINCTQFVSPKIYCIVSTQVINDGRHKKEKYLLVKLRGRMEHRVNMRSEQKRTTKKNNSICKT